MNHLLKHFTVMRRPSVWASALLLSMHGHASTARAQGSASSAVIAPTDNLVVEGIPPIPVSLAAEVGRYTEARSAGFVDWHPTKREMLVTTRFGNTPQIHAIRMPGGARTQLTFFAEPVGSAS